MEKQDWQRWKEYTLNPAIFQNINRIFPELEFQLVRGGSKWISRHRLNGDTTSQSDRIYIAARKPHLISENGGRTLSITDYYAERRGTDFSTAQKELASLSGVDYPQVDSVEWKAYEEQQKNREAANDRFKEALFSDDEGAKAVLSYLIGRGWTEAEIKEAELGYINVAIRDSLPNCQELNTYTYDKENRVKLDEVGITHRLTIPFRNGSRLLGFKVRDINYIKTPNRQKYLNTKGLRKEGLFGLLPILPKEKDCIIVEGELDALHAKVKGVENIAATTGGKLSEEMINEAERRGYSRFTLLFDTDPAGKEYTKESLSSLERVGVEAWVAELPEEVKDVDEYLAKPGNSIESFHDLIEDALTSYEWTLHQAALLFYKKAQVDRTRKLEEDFLAEAEAIINSPAMLERPLYRTRLKEYIKNNEESLGIKWESIEAWVEQRYNRQAATKRRADAAAASQQIAALMGEGKVDEAITLMGETSRNLTNIERGEELSKIFAPLTWGEYCSLLQSIPQGIPTGFRIDGEELSLNAGITFVCAPTGHGKTSLLNNLILNEAKRNRALGNGKSVAYFSLEIDKRRLLADLLNTYLNDPELHTERANNPIFAVYRYFESGGSREAFRDGQHYNKFVAANESFYTELIASGALTIVDKNYLIGELIAALRYYLTISKPSAIFIDYAQLIYKEGQSRQRTEEIKEIVNEINIFAKETGLPIVMAAQFNRQVDSPLSVLSKNIGEGGDFERIADTIIGLFNLEKKGLGSSLSEYDKKTLAKLLNGLLRKRGDTYQVDEKNLEPIPGRIYIKLLKRRYGKSDGEELLKWEGKTKYIEPNHPEALRTAPQQATDFKELKLDNEPSNENTLPF